MLGGLCAAIAGEWCRAARRIVALRPARVGTLWPALIATLRTARVTGLRARRITVRGARITALRAARIRPARRDTTGAERGGPARALGLVRAVGHRTSRWGTDGPLRRLPSRPRLWAARNAATVRAVVVGRSHRNVLHTLIRVGIGGAITAVRMRPLPRSQHWRPPGGPTWLRSAAASCP